MFEINDAFLSNIGYDVDSLSEEQKAKYKAEYTEEFSNWVQKKILAKLDERQIEEFSEIENSPERARQWLDEFHSDYRDRDDYKTIRAGLDQDEADTFYATSLWFSYAVPKYGELIRDELEAYQSHLVGLRQQAAEIAKDINL